jgi:hypothetical protein
MKSKFFLLSFILFAGWVFATEVDKPLEFTVYSGVSLAADTLENSGPCFRGLDCPGGVFTSKISVNNSALFGFGVGYYFTRNFELEGNFAIAPTHQFRSETNVVGFVDQDLNLVSYNYDANFVYNFDWKGIRPFLTAGIGGITRDNISVTTDFTYNFGIGTKFYYKDLGLRLELKDQIIPDYFQLGNKKNVLQIQSGIFFGF